MATSPNMAAITASLERSLQNCSLNNNNRRGSTASNVTGGAAPGDGFSDSSENHHAFDTNPSSDATLDLNSEVSLPYHWEQCLDLKTGEIYYINWRTGMKAKEDPRANVEAYGENNLYSEDEDDNSYYSEGSSSEESSFSSSREQPQISTSGKSVAPVLVVGGCKSCLMYFMVPKEVEDCPKCCGQLLHFDQN
ncbi:protein CURLY FLAG LEAF 1 [Lycium barbarum]|uniref:protein CURLY FLAG LEAF 1 n=1 Tax=Lycium barbarum TaxID=112863 RepID=UPI00293E7997|nr:protein CURLY FLAG LEAF 1 [Lycium barbarum]